MHRLASALCILTFAAGCGTSTTQPDAGGTNQTGSVIQTARINIQGFKKSKSGAT